VSENVVATSSFPAMDFDGIFVSLHRASFGECFVCTRLQWICWDLDLEREAGHHSLQPFFIFDQGPWM
jgi:hypothetical protein